MRFLFSIALTLCSAHLNASELLVTTVGKIRSRVVTSRDVYISGWMEAVLYPSPGVSASEVTLPGIETGEFKKLLNAFFLESVVALESKSFSVVKVEDRELNRKLKILQTVKRKSRYLQQLGVQEAELRRALEKKLSAKMFINFKAESSVVSVTDAEARAYYENHRIKFGDLPFENFKENIKVFLTREQVDKRLKDWFEVLQSKYKVESTSAQGL